MQQDKTIQGADLAWANVTAVHPLGLAMILVMGAATLCLPRRYAVVPMLIVACFVAPAQRLVVMGLDFNFLRLMVLFAWARLALRSEFQQLRWHRLDSVMLVWAAVGSAVYTIQQGTVGALVYKLGVSFDAIGMYFFFRCVVRGLPDLLSFIRASALISIPVATFLLFERSTGRNVFAVFGGVPDLTVVRFGKLRAQGAFAHAILAGTFWIALGPTILALWWRAGTDRVLAAIGMVTITFIVIACASSTPIAGAAALLIGVLAWPLRNQMRSVRWGILGSLVGLHLIMKAPVWHLIGRIDLVGGSTGYHRYRLIDAAINNFTEWAVIGTNSTAHWGHALYDVTNHYILEGVRGGFVTLVLFVMQIVIAFAAIGRLRESLAGDRRNEILAWFLGVAMFVHVCVFIAVSYFGQIIVIWYLLLAVCASLDPTSERIVATRSVRSGRVQAVALQPLAARSRVRV